MMENCTFTLPVTMFLWTMASMMIVTLLVMLVASICLVWDSLKEWQYRCRLNKEWDQRTVDREAK